MAEEQDNSSIQGSDLEENAKQWEKELTSESGEDELPTDEDNQLTQEESEEETEEDSDLEDDEADEEIEAEEEEPEEDLHEVKYDGKTHQVTLQQLKDSFSKGQNYTRKSQALADDRNSLEDSKAEISQLRGQALEALEYAKQNQPQTPERTDEYWNNLRDSDPVQFLIERDAVRDAQMQSQVVDQEIERLNYKKEAEQQEHLNKHLDSEKEKLLVGWLYSFQNYIDGVPKKEKTDIFARSNDIQCKESIDSTNGIPARERENENWDTGPSGM